MINIGVSISEETVTVSACTPRKHGIQTYKYAQTRFALSHHERMDVDFEQAARALKDAVIALKIRRCDCILSIPLQQAVYGFIETSAGAMSKQTRALIDNHIQKELDVKPHEAISIQWDAPNLYGSEETQRARHRVGYIALERRILRVWRQFCANAGLHMARITLDAPSILHLAELYGFDKTQKNFGGHCWRALLEVKERTTICIISRDQRVTVINSLPWGLRDAYANNTCAGLGEVLQKTLTHLFQNKLPREFTWHILAPEELINPIDNFINQQLRFHTSPLKMLIEIPPRVHMNGFIKAVAATASPKLYTF